MGKIKDIATDLAEKELLTRTSTVSGRKLFSYDGIYWFVSPLKAAIFFKRLEGSAHRKITEGKHYNRLASEQKNRI